MAASESSQLISRLLRMVLKIKAEHVGFFGTATRLQLAIIKSEKMVEKREERKIARCFSMITGIMEKFLAIVTRCLEAGGT